MNKVIQILNDTTDAIREKEGSTEEIAYLDIPERVRNLSGGGDNVIKLPSEYEMLIFGKHKNTYGHYGIQTKTNITKNMKVTVYGYCSKEDGTNVLGGMISGGWSS